MPQDCNKNFDVKLCEIDLFLHLCHGKVNLKVGEILEKLVTSMLYYWLQKVFFIQKSKKDWFFQGINWKQ